MTCRHSYMHSLEIDARPTGSIRESRAMLLHNIHSLLLCALYDHISKIAKKELVKYWTIERSPPLNKTAYNTTYSTHGISINGIIIFRG